VAPDPYTPPPRDPREKTIGELVLDVSEQTSRLIRDEIDLAKAEISEKVNQLIRSSTVAIVAGVFAFFALILFMHAFAWFLAVTILGDHVWLGYLVAGLIFVAIGAGAGYYAYRNFQTASPPIPNQAIEEAKLTRAALEKPE
jgi:H+/Cl- antiporter ClcA